MQRLDEAAVERNQATFSNIRLWDPQPLLDSYRQLQLIRLYYDFHDVDVDRYELEGARRQVMLAAREISPSLLPPNARTWVNQRLQFTHGFGAVMSPVTEIEGEGLPGFFLKDIPPQSPVGLELAEPRIYFGEETDDYVIVNAAAEEFDYPKGEQNVSNSYGGKDGVALGSWLRRALFAWSFRDVNLLISGNLRAESRILFRRAIADRISTIAPFLLLDRDPYVVVSGGRLYWIQDAYTTAETFPYSEPVAGADLQLHPQLGEGRRRRLRRDGHLLRHGREGARPRGLRPDLSRALPAIRRDARGSPRPRALSGGSLPRSRRRCTARTT